MALSYLPVDRDQQFLLPPDMREWLPEGHLAWFVLDVVERLDASVLHEAHPNVGVGRRAYDPEVLLAVLIYAYCTGVRSSRRIEQLCEVDVAFRVLAGGYRPDHSTVARFRQAHEVAAQGLFCDVLMLCQQAGLAKVGVVAVDGTKVAADAALRANRTRERIEAEVEAMFGEAAATDAAEDRLLGDRRGDELPAELADRRRRGARLDAALAELDAQRAAREAKEAAEREARRAKWQDQQRDGDGGGGRSLKGFEVDHAAAAVEREERRGVERVERRAATQAAAAEQGRKLRGRKPHPEGHRELREARARLERARARAVEAAAAADGDALERVNVTDPDSRIMHSPKGWVQGYNAQAAVTEDGIVAAAAVTQDGNDVEQCEPMLARTKANLADAGIATPVGAWLFDAGYLSDANITAVGSDGLIATSKSWKLKNSDPTSGEPPPDATLVAQMSHRLRSPEGSALYAKRQHTVEPVFGDIKHLRGFRRFSRRGFSAVDAEWALVATVHNILKLFRAHTATAATT